MNELEKAMAEKLKSVTMKDYLPAPVHTDGIFSIRMIGDTIRITTFSYVAASEEQPQPVITGVIAISLPAFLKSVEVIDDYVKNLEKAGVVKKT